MKVIKNGEVAEEDATNAPIFFGGRVSKQDLVGKNLTRCFDFNLVNFAAGARNKLHTHTCDQVLFVTKGVGTVATENAETVIGEGDTAFIPAGEKHWHGAAAGSDFSHISLLKPDSATQIAD